MILRRKWAACWDCSPFGIRIERRCFTRRGARLVAARHASWSREPGRWFVETVENAKALSARIYEHTQAAIEIDGPPLLNTRWDLQRQEHAKAFADSVGDLFAEPLGVKREH